MNPSAAISDDSSTEELLVIETAGQLHREIHRRGLHIRSKVDKDGEETYGRDNELLKEFAGSLGLSEETFQRSLDESNLSAAEYLVAFVSLTSQFSQMFTEIWEFLCASLSPQAKETIQLRFGFQFEKSGPIDWEQFCLLARDSQLITTSIPYVLWHPTFLFDLCDRLKLPKSQRQSSGCTYSGTPVDLSRFFV